MTRTKKYNENELFDDQLTIDPIAAGKNEGGIKWYLDACHQMNMLFFNE